MNLWIAFMVDIILFLSSLQQITQHQERFVHMLNEPRGGDTRGQGAEAPGSVLTNYIQVTPQEKEAIERVSYVYQLPCTCRASIIKTTGH